MKSKHLYIEIGNLNDAHRIALEIPEFNDLYTLNEFEDRLKTVTHLILVAYYKNKPVGFKIGYETLKNKHFYSWMGGVLPKYRKAGVAQLLLDFQEEWIIEKKYKRILVKTRKKHLSMINFLGKNGYYELGSLPNDPDEETRILFDKELN